MSKENRKSQKQLQQEKLHAQNTHSPPMNKEAVSNKWRMLIQLRFIAFQDVE